MSKVVLIAHTPNPEEVVATAARLCYSPLSIYETRQDLTREKITSLLNMLRSSGHYSTFEHANFTFGIEEVSRSLLAQITRHRIGSFCVQSQRYVNEDNYKFVIPEEIKNCEEAKEDFVNVANGLNDCYKRITDILIKKHTQNFINEGVTEKKALQLAHKKAIEDARYILPNACNTKMICTFNARSLINFFKLRCCNRAQWEIREVANKMLQCVNEVAPLLFLNAGPPCLSGTCPEGKMTCGKQEKVKKEYDKMFKE